MATKDLPSAGFGEARSAALQAFSWEERDYTAIYRERLKRLNQLRDQTPHKELDDGTIITAGQARLAALEIFYKTNPTAFIEDWIITYDPRALETEGRTAYMPFVMFERQHEFINFLLDRWRAGKDGVVEKSREVGISWLMMAFALWMWRFHPGAKIGFGTYKEQKLDKLGDMDSLFEKGRLLLKMLPVELLPTGFNHDEHATFCKFINPQNGAAVTGEAGDNIGRGGRATMYFIDEAAFLEHPDRAEAALSQTSNCRIWASTANGMGNPFYRKVTSGKFPVFRFCWQEDPRKNDAWYAEQQEKLEPHILAQEVDIDYTASIERVCIPQRWIRSAVKINNLVDWPIYRSGVAGLDVAAGGANKSVYVARFGPFVDPTRSWSSDPNLAALIAMDHAKKDKVNAINFDAIGVGAGTSATFEREKAWEHAVIEPKTPLDARQVVTAYIQVNPINAGDRPSDEIWPDEKRASEKFANLRAELWWIMRDRFLKTHEHVLWIEGKRGGRQHPLEELIAMPNDPTLQAQLSLPTWDATNGGKVLIESKASMRKRGVPSPDHADALALTFAPATLSGSFQSSDLGGLI